jgi:hypothetical protein
MIDYFLFSLLVEKSLPLPVPRYIYTGPKTIIRVFQTGNGFPVDGFVCRG